MEKFYFQKLMLSCLVYFLISADAFSAANLDQTNLSQIDAMAEAHIINKRGSDQSLQESTKIGRAHV